MVVGTHKPTTPHAPRAYTPTKVNGVIQSSEFNTFDLTLPIYDPEATDYRYRKGVITPG